MKASKIILKDYLHFKKGLEIDLTYPIGHKKAGQPLDRVCFLGQSGTGKTTLLNIIKCFSCGEEEYDKSNIATEKLKKDSVTVFFKAGKLSFSKTSLGKDLKFDWWDYSRTPRKKITNSEEFLKKEIEPQLKNRSHLLLNFPFCVVGPHDIPNGKQGEHEKGVTKFNIPSPNIDKFIASKGEIADKPFSDRMVWDFNHSNIRAIWNIVFNKVSVYISEYNKRKLLFAEKSLDKITEANEYKGEFEKWEKENPNPILELSEKFLNPILEHFSLEVETDIRKYPVDTSDKEKYVIIKSKNNGEVVEYPFLSTGTKQIMLTGIPLFFLKPQKSIILFDQPETSLYPNIQLSLPEIYFNIASDTNQFFFATHSPIVASAFDPWEIVELRFDTSNGEVYRKEYYEGNKKARKQSSYTINPKLLRWDSSYKILFDTPVEGNSERGNELMALATLESKIKKLKTNGAQKKKMVDEYKALAKKLDWNN